jgi:hypothetical protein
MTCIPVGRSEVWVHDAFVRHGERGARESMFDWIPRVLQQVKAVGNLPRLRRPAFRTGSIEAAPRAADDLNHGMLGNG